MIKTFEEYQVDKGQLFESKAAFNAAVEMCKAHYEEEKIKIHEYYKDQLAEKFDHEPPVGSEENAGKLT